MILIQADLNDLSVRDVIEWIEFLSPQEIVKHLAGESKITSVNIDISNDRKATFTLCIDSSEVIENLKSIWYKGGRFSFVADNFIDEKYPEFVQKISFNSSKEIAYVTSSLYHSMKQSRINGFGDNFTNKLNNLINAKSIGFCVPNTLISNSSEKIVDFSRAHKNIVIKDIEFDPILFQLDDQFCAFVSPAVTKLEFQQIDMLLNGSNSISHVLFCQQYIDKSYEVRTFFLKGRCYSMAIFSQANEKTRVDFRNYDYLRPNRCVPFNVPDTIEEKVRALMAYLNLESGSLDFIVDSQGCFVFLEVNPVGVFNWVSKKCNYEIEKHIAELLINPM